MLTKLPHGAASGSMSVFELLDLAELELLEAELAEGTVTLLLLDAAGDEVEALGMVPEIGLFFRVRPKPTKAINIISAAISRMGFLVSFLNLLTISLF